MKQAAKKKRAPPAKAPAKAAKAVRPIAVKAAPKAGQSERVVRYKIFPRNLTARAEYLVAGNPAISRLEDSVANCFPGLEMDVRNLDRRFFPGLVFEFTSGLGEGTNKKGARLAYVDLYQDPELRPGSDLLKELADLENNLAEFDASLAGLDENERKKRRAERAWFLDWIEQKGKKIRVRGMDGTTVWRFVRSLEQGSVTIGLWREKEENEDKERKKKKAKRKKKEEHLSLTGRRRRFTDPRTGVLSAAYQPGELMQGLCSPWQHDFRDCACFYWAASRPDIVLGELYPGESVPLKMDQPSAIQAPDDNKPVVPAGEEPFDPTIPLDWMRRDHTRAREAEAMETIELNRPAQIDHFEINRVWQDLSIVVEGREIGGLYVPQTIDAANPFASPAELADALATKLGPLELALTFEYLYARSSLRNEKDVQDRTLRGALTLARERLLLVAVSEMQHLRWVNQILWGLFQDGLVHEFKPVLAAADRIPKSTATALTQPLPRVSADLKERREILVRQFIKTERLADVPRATTPQADDKHYRDAAHRDLTPEVIEDFIAVEHPSAYIDSAYARVVATLRQRDENDPKRLVRYPEHLVELALRIVSDGVQHEKRFREIKAALSFLFPQPGQEDHPPQYIRRGFRPATRTEAAKAVAPLEAIKASLREAYRRAAGGDFDDSSEHITKARVAMITLRDVGEEFAADSLGIPYLDLWKEIP